MCRYVTVKGQTTQEIVTTQYSSPLIRAVSPTQFSTSGGTTIVITGEEFGTSDNTASFRVVFTKGASVSECAQAVGTCHEIAAVPMSTLSNGNERVSFSSPSGFGPDWNLRLIVTNAQTGQSVFADVDCPVDKIDDTTDTNTPKRKICPEAPISVGYANPSIDAVTIVQNPSSFTLTILGANFCDRGAENCGDLYLCGSSNDAETYCDAFVGYMTWTVTIQSASLGAASAGVAVTQSSNSGVGTLAVALDGSAATTTITIRSAIGQVFDNAQPLVIDGTTVTVTYVSVTQVTTSDHNPYALSTNPILTITSWSHTKIVATIGVGKDWIFIQVGQGVGTQAAKSNNAYFSTIAMTIVSGADFTLNGADLEHAGRIPTSGSGDTKLTIHVLNLPSGANTGNTFVKVNDISGTTSSITEVVQGDNDKMAVEFTVPAGSGAKQTVKVQFGVTATQNSAYLYYARPVITNVLMPATPTTNCDAVSPDCPSIDVSPGIIPTSGALVTIIGNNLGVSSDPNTFLFRWQSDDASFVDDLHKRDSSYFEGACVSADHTHTRVKCTLPASQGIGYTLYVEVANQISTQGAFPGNGKSISYAPPTLNSATAVPAGLVPSNAPTSGPTTILINGANFGLLQPTMVIDGKACVVQIAATYHTAFQCIVHDGEGKDHAALITTGGAGTGQTSSGGATFSYDAPTVTNFEPKTVSTSGKDASGAPVNMTITGSNFGTTGNDAIQVIFRTLTESPNKDFVISAADLTIRSHTELSFPIPEGYGASVDILVVVRGQTSAIVADDKFSYAAPTVASIAPLCGEFDCYGYRKPGYFDVADYPKIISITAGSDGNSAVQLEIVKSFPLEVGMQIQLQGMSKAKGVASKAAFNYDGTWFVTAVDSTTMFKISSSEKESSKGLPTADRYLGFNNPQGNLRALASRVYVHAKSESFNMLETDGCQSRDISGIRDTGWEPYQFFAARIAQADSSTIAKRQCGFGEQNNTQTIVITGTNFGRSGTTLSTPLTVTMRQKVCDCSKELDGSLAPCMSPTLRQCFAKDSSGACPAATINCDLDTEYQQPKQLEIKSHDHERIEVFSYAGFGRRHQISVSIGNTRPAVPSNAEEAFMRYMPPTVTGFETPASQAGGSKIYRPDGTSRITILGYNFGSYNVTSSLDVRIGVEYDASGKYCGNDDKCMKPCSSAQWYPAKEGGDSMTRGFPYIDCIIPQDTAGFKNISVSIAGQKDDCSTNLKLCGFPIAYPADRRSTPIDENTNLTALINRLENDPNGGLVFTCARSSESSQSYAKPGELCQNIDNGMEKEECEDAACSKPKARPGFFRLDLDLQFACNEGDNNEPCQADLTGVGLEGGNSLASSFKNDYIGFTTGNTVEDGLQKICSAGSQVGTNATTCAAEQRQCSKRGGAAPGSCIFRRPLEARRAMGKEYWPFACPGTDLSDVYDKENLQAAKDKCRAANPDTYKFVDELVTAGCPAARTQHLVDYSVYDEFPALDMSTTCYSVVACNPKSSCIGGNKCGVGYEFQKFKCQQWNINHPNKTSCTSDYECRTRSGKNSDSDNGLTSACAEDSPEDCSRCVMQTNPETGIQQGQCECTGGGPRCGLCTRGITEDEANKYSIGVSQQAGYFRLNDECQKCPENIPLIIAAFCCALVFSAIGAWYMEDKKVNFAFLSIGIDYFQVLAIFARIPVKWPDWVRFVLQLLSIFNFNIDIAAPECLYRDFDYKWKWITTMLLPVIFMALLLLIFLIVLGWKCCKKCLKIGGKSPKYCSHANKLIAVFIIVFYFIYLSITRRALDIFNCNPVDPPDGYLYAEFASKDCEGGICRCDDPQQLQSQLKPYAILGLLVYTIGFPVYVIIITWFYRVQMKLDQLLRAHELGETRSDAVDSIELRPRKCRSRTKATYDIRKKYHKLYYHFKPGKVYWMMNILIRKIGIAVFALLFRRNVAFMLSCCLLLLFACYVLQVRHKPYMSSVERDSVKEDHRLKAHEAELQLHESSMEEIDRDLFMHLQMNRAITQLQENLERKRNKKRNVVVRSLSVAAQRQSKRNETKDYYFDYNTVEQVLIASAIFLCLIAIMFESGQFYIIDPITGLETLNEDPSSKSFYTAVLVFGGLVLFGSLTYYGVVFMAEVVGHVPGFIRSCCASKKSRQMKKQENEDDDLDDEGFEMVQNNMYANPLADLEKAKGDAAKQQQRNRQLLEENKAKDKQTIEMMAQMKRLKQENQRNLAHIKDAKHGHHGRTPRSRKEMVSGNFLDIFWLSIGIN